MSIMTQQRDVVVPAGEWHLDPVWSSLEFEVKKLGLMTIKGRVPGFTGTIRGGESPSLAGVVDATGITTFGEAGGGPPARAGPAAAGRRPAGAASTPRASRRSTRRATATCSRPTSSTPPATRSFGS